MEFVQHYMKLLPQEVDISCVLKDCQEKIAYTSTDFYFTFFKPSVIGASCLASTLIGKDLLTNKQRQTFYLHLANTSNLIDILKQRRNSWRSTKKNLLVILYPKLAIRRQLHRFRRPVLYPKHQAVLPQALYPK